MRDSLRLIDLVGLDAALVSMPATARAAEKIRADSLDDAAEFEDIREARSWAVETEGVELTPELTAVLMPPSHDCETDGWCQFVHPVRGEGGYEDLRALITYDHAVYARDVLGEAVNAMLDAGIAREDIDEAIVLIGTLS